MSGGPSLANRLGLQLTNYAVVYGASTVFTFLVGVANLTILTHYLSVDEFGLLAVLLVFAAFLTIIYNLVVLQGTFGLVFGGGDEEGGLEVDESDDLVPKNMDKRRTLTTGLCATAAVCFVGSFVVCAFAPQLSTVLGGVPAGWVRLAAASGAAGSMWRFVVNVLRYERRPVAFVLTSALRPIFVLGISIPLVVNGNGVSGVLFATVVGTGAAVLVALVISLSNYALALQASMLAPISKRGYFLVPVIIAFWIIHNADLYLVSLWTGEEEVATYRVAARLAAGVSYFVSAFLMAWMPLARTLLHQAVTAEHGVPRTGGTMVRYFWAASLWVVLGLALLSDVMVKIAPATYGAAAPLIPIIGAGFVAYGGFIIVHRVGKFPGRLKAYIGLACLGAVVFAIAAVLLIPRYGAYGAAVAPLIGFSFALIAELYMCQRGAEPLEIPYLKMAGTTLLAIALWTVGHFLGGSISVARVVLDLMLLIAFPILLSELDLLHIPGITALRESSKRAREASFRERMPDASEEWEVAERLLGGTSTGEAATQLGLSEGEVFARFNRLLEQVAGRTIPEKARAPASRYLLMEGPAAIRDDASEHAIGAGIAPEALIDLETAHDVVMREARARARARGEDVYAEGSDDEG